MNERDDQLLNDLLDGRLSDEEAAALRARIAAEAPLRERHDALVRVGQWLRAEDPAKDLEAPPSFLADVTARIANDGGESAATDSSESGGADTATSQQPGGYVLRMSDAAQAHDATSGRPPALRLLGFAYAAAALLVVGLGVGFVLSGSPDEPPATELAKQSDLDKQHADAGGMAEGLLDKEKLTGGRFPGHANGVNDVPKGALRGTAGHGGLSTLREQQAAGRNAPADGAAVGSGPRIVGPGGRVPPGLRPPSDDPAPLPRMGGGRKAPHGQMGKPARAAAPAPRLMYAVHAEDPAAARAGLQLMLFQIAQADAVRARAEPVESKDGGAVAGTEPLVPAAEEAESDVEHVDKSDPAINQRAKGEARGAPMGKIDGVPAGQADAPALERAAQPAAPGFELRRLEVASLDRLVVEKAKRMRERGFRADGQWEASGRRRGAGPPPTGAPTPPAPASGPSTPAPGAMPAPTPPSTPTPADADSSPATPTPETRTPETRAAGSEPAPLTARPGPARDGSDQGGERAELADGVVDRVLTLRQLRSLEARFGIRATDVRLYEARPASKQDGGAEQLVRVRFVFIKGRAPR